MWQNIKYYVLALAIILLGTFTSTGLQLLQGHLPVGHPAGALAANLSGVTLGSIIMVIGFLKDNRVDQERKRADHERKRAETAEAKIAEEQLKAAVAETKAQQESERAERYLAELERFRESYEKTTKALIQLLQERDGNHPPNPGSTR